MADVERLEDELNMAISRVDRNYPDFQKIQDRYQNYYDKRDQIIACIQYPELDIPRTTNLIEGFNSTTLEIRLSSIRGFEKTNTAEGYINALILKRRFQKFTDCKGKFKSLNGSRYGYVYHVVLFFEYLVHRKLGNGAFFGVLHGVRIKNYDDNSDL